MIKLAEMATRKRILGWCRPHQGHVVGRVTCLKRNEATARAVVNAAFQQATFGEVRTINSTRLARDLPRFQVLEQINPSAPWMKDDYVWIDRIDHRGWLIGWAFCPHHPKQRLQLSIKVNDNLVAEAVANCFRRDLLEKGIGDGECAFSVKIPESLLDGSSRDVSVTLDGGTATCHMVPRGAPKRRLPFPRSFAIEAPWRSTSGLEGFSAIKHRIMSKGLEAGVEDLRAELERSPEAVFFDAGVAEAFSREARPFYSFLERLAHRFERRDCPQLIRAFNSKSLTKEYCQNKGIRTAKTLLLSDRIEEIRAFKFPDRFVIKPTKDSGTCNFLFYQGLDLLSRRNLSLKDILSQIEVYKTNKPSAQFIIEELHCQYGATSPSIPVDYKFHVFGGKVRFIHVDDRNVFSSRDGLYRQQGWFSKNWRPAPFKIRVMEEEAIDFSVPQSFLEMIKIAESIGHECRDYVRVDLYDTAEGPALGEVTTFSHAGVGFTEYGDFVLAQAWEVSPMLAAVA